MNIDQILKDTEFWTELEYVSSNWLSRAATKDLRRLWIDGFEPESSRSTNVAVEITGMVWLGGAETEDQYRFRASIP